MTTDELNAIVQAVMLELEKAGVDFDFKAETPQADDLVYVMRGTADKYQGITVKWQNLLDIIVKKATDAKDEAVSAKDIALQTLATIQGIESNVSSMKSSVETTANDVSTMKASVEASESNVTQMKSDVSGMKTSVETTKSDVEGLKSDVTTLKAQTQTIVDNAKNEVTGLLDTKVNYSDALSYTDIINSSNLSGKVASASALKEVATLDLLWTNASPTSAFSSQTISLDLSKYSMVYIVTKRKNDNDNLHGSKVIKKGESAQIFTYLFGAGLSYREISSVSNSGVNFYGGVYQEINNNEYGIPIYIYGIK